MIRYDDRTSGAPASPTPAANPHPAADAAGRCDRRDPGELGRELLALRTVRPHVTLSRLHDELEARR